MNAAEADRRAELCKQEIVPTLVALDFDTKKQILLDVSDYRSGEDSCGSVYMGSLATAQMIRLLGGSYGKNGIKELLKSATEVQVDDAISYAWSYIDYMNKHPRSKCPCCGQIVAGEAK